MLTIGRTGDIYEKIFIPVVNLINNIKYSIPFIAVYLESKVSPGQDVEVVAKIEAEKVFKTQMYSILVNAIKRAFPHGHPRIKFMVRVNYPVADIIINVDKTVYIRYIILLKLLKVEENLYLVAVKKLYYIIRAKNPFPLAS